MPKKLALFLLLLALPVSPAFALCSGAGAVQEFREADVVVRANLVSEETAWDDEPDTEFRTRWGGGGPVVLYRLRIVEIFKGAPGPRIRFFQERNSGAFYLEPEKDYLLYLNYIPPSRGRPAAARGAMYVRYSCGGSKAWSEISPVDLAVLRRLSARR